MNSKLALFGLRNVPVFTTKSLVSTFGIRHLANDARTGSMRHAGRRRAAATEQTKFQSLSGSLAGPMNVGQIFVAGSSVVGIGALIYYGLGLSNEPGAIDKHMLWPQYVKSRIQSTFAYFGSSLVLAGGTAMAAFSSPSIRSVVMRQGPMAIFACIAAQIGSSMLVRSIPYEVDSANLAKKCAWALHCVVVGGVIAPICMLGGPILIRAAAYTAAMTASLSTVALCAPSEKFLMMGGPLAMGFGAVFIASIGSAFLPPTSMAGVTLYSFAVYGGLVIFGGLMLYDVQRIIAAASHLPADRAYGGWPGMAYGEASQKQVANFDPVNHSIGIFMITINIFVRMAQILAMGGNRRK